MAVRTPGLDRKVCTGRHIVRPFQAIPITRYAPRFQTAPTPAQANLSLSQAGDSAG